MLYWDVPTLRGQKNCVFSKTDLKSPQIRIYWTKWLCHVSTQSTENYYALEIEIQIGLAISEVAP